MHGGHDMSNMHSDHMQMSDSEMMNMPMDADMDTAVLMPSGYFISPKHGSHALVRKRCGDRHSHNEDSETMVAFNRIINDEYVGELLNRYGDSYPHRYIHVQSAVGCLIPVTGFGGSC
jgi:hypothetical protein